VEYVIIGGGIIGIAVGSEIARRKLGNVTILEKESSLGKHASGRNSGVIHSGINQKPGSLKAKMCVEGSRRLREFCKKRGVPMNECGTLVVARHEKEMEILKRLLQMGKECGVEPLFMITGNELKSREPFAKGMAALFSANGATVDSLHLLQALSEDAKSLGVKFKLNSRVVKINGKEIKTASETIQTDHVVNCAGLYADKIAHQMDVGREYRVIPFRGEYMEVKDCDVRTMIYQPPDLRFPFLSIHLTHETDGRVLAGPSAVLALGRESYEKEVKVTETLEMFFSPQFIKLALSPTFLNLAVQNAKTSLSKQAFLKQIQSLVPSIQLEQLVPYRAGIRAQMVNKEGRMMDDILVEYRKDSTHVLNAVSPGMTCSLAFAEYVVDNMMKT